MRRGLHGMTARAAKRTSARVASRSWGFGAKTVANCGRTVEVLWRRVSVGRARREMMTRARSKGAGLVMQAIYLSRGHGSPIISLFRCFDVRLLISRLSSAI